MTDKKIFNENTISDSLKLMDEIQKEFSKNPPSFEALRDFEEKIFGIYNNKNMKAEEDMPLKKIDPIFHYNNNDQKSSRHFKDGYWCALDWQIIPDDYEYSPHHIVAGESYHYDIQNVPDKFVWNYQTPDKNSTGLSLKRNGFTHYAVINEPTTSGMSLEHGAHLQQIKDFVCDLIDKKYRKGVEEHGGKLWEKPLDWFEKEIENEIVDLAVYFVTRLMIKNEKR